MDRNRDQDFTDGWTLRTLKRLMDERDKRYEIVSENAKTAVSVAEKNAEKWRDNANEWRAAMSDKDRNFVTKATLWAYGVGMVGLVLSLITIMKLMGG